MEHAHLDIKCENILLDHNLNVKIADFGFSRLRAEVNIKLGSGIHRAPEICLYQNPYDGEKADVFAAGVVLYTIQMLDYPVPFNQLKLT
jgi:serine/threonine protein kinase